MNFPQFGNSSSVLQVDEESTSSSAVSDGPHTTDGCYDGDISNSSTEYNVSIEEEIGNTTTLHKGFNEGAKNITGFYPTSEETVFVDPADSLIDRVLQSPRYSEKEWMVYGSSNDEYCYEQSSDNDTQDTSSDIEISSGSKRQKHEHQLFHVYDSEGRIHGELGCTDVSNRYTSYSYSKKMKPKPQDAQVDVRIIDFAHTSFVHGSTCNSTSMVYQGPDSGFLTGLDSLRRLLLEILTEG